MGGEPINYKDGTLDVPHLGITLRTVFAAAERLHDKSKGRKVKVNLRGVYVGTIQLASPKPNKEQNGNP